MKILPAFPALLLLVIAPGCASGPLPISSPTNSPAGTLTEGRRLLAESARRQGNDWNRYREVRVAYDGRWSFFPKVTQPVLVDAGFRGSSEEIYEPRRGLVRQVHTGPKGEKTVVRQRGRDTVVTYNGERSSDAEVKAAAALVADAYASFLFGASWLLEHGSDFRSLSSGRVGPHVCDQVEATLRPGLGVATSDRMTLWIDRETKWVRRVYFTLNGLDSTQGAEVDVTMDRFVTAPDGSVWPTHFVEMIRKPVNTKAHEWSTVALSADGMGVK